jgi:hypothetical protein
MNPEFPFNQGGQQPVQPQTPPQPTGYQPFGPQAPQPFPGQPAPTQNGMQPGYSPLPPVQTPPLKRRTSKKWLILTFVFLFTTIAAAGLGVWALLNYFDQRDTVQSQVTTAVATAVKEQQDKDAADFLEKEKQPNRQFAGPDDYGSLSFDYPKTWSVYVAKDAVAGGAYEAYLNPVSVPPTSNKEERFALRVVIEQETYEDVIGDYEKLVKKGDLVSKSATINGESATRLEGNFDKDLRGIAVIFRIRDKTVTLTTDAMTFQNDFDALVNSITFNK